MYVYFTYGMHFCANIVTGSEGKGEAVLIRAVEPIAGVEVMRKNRGIGAPEKRGNGDGNLTNGPARLCQAFGIRREKNGTDLLGDQIFIVDEERIPARMIGRSTRIGIRNGIEKRWRFFVKGNAWVSRVKIL